MGWERFYNMIICRKGKSIKQKIKKYLSQILYNSLIVLILIPLSLERRVVSYYGVATVIFRVSSLCWFPVIKSRMYNMDQRQLS